MIDAETPPPRRIITSQYHGSEYKTEFGRTVEHCQTLWNQEIKVGTFDYLLVNQLEQAKTRKKNRIVVLDVGSGNGSLFRSFLSESNFGTKTRAFLSANKDFMVEMIGITDAKSTDDFLRDEEIVPDLQKINNPPDNSQIRAKNIRYTFTYNQRLTNVLKHLDLDNIDLCVSTVACTYLGSKTFEFLLDDIIGHLNPGGEFIAYGYADRGIAPGFVQPDPMFSTLDIKDVNKQPASIKATLDEKSLRFNRKNADIAAEEQMLEKTEELMVRLGALTSEELDQRRKEFLNDPDLSSDRAMTLARRASTLTLDENNLITKKAKEVRQIKQGILDTLFKKYGERINGQVEPRTIFIHKN